MHAVRAQARFQQSPSGGVTVKSYRVGIDATGQIWLENSKDCQIWRSGQGGNQRSRPNLKAFNTAWCLLTHPSL